MQDKSTKAPIRLTDANFAAETRFVPRASREMLRFALGLSVGSLTVTLPDGRVFMVDTGQPGPTAEILIRNWRFARRVLPLLD